MSKFNFTVIIEQGEDGAYIASVPSLKSCYTQATTVTDVIDKIKEVIELCLEEESVTHINKFIGVQQLEIIV